MSGDQPRWSTQLKLASILPMHLGSWSRSYEFFFFFKKKMPDKKRTWEDNSHSSCIECFTALQISKVNVMQNKPLFFFSFSFSSLWYRHLEIAFKVSNFQCPLVTQTKERPKIAERDQFFFLSLQIPLKKDKTHPTFRLSGFGDTDAELRQTRRLESKWYCVFWDNLPTTLQVKF